MSLADQQVWIVDPDRGTATSLEPVLAGEAISVRPVATAEDFLAVCEPAMSGCLVMEQALPGKSGVELLQALRDRDVCVPTIVLTAAAEVSTTVRCLQSGAFTVLQKPCDGKKLGRAIRDALAWEARTRNQRIRQLQVRKRVAGLTESEYRVMRLMVAGFPNKSIAARLDVSVRTVESRRKEVYRKLATRHIAGLVAAVHVAEHPLPCPCFERAGRVTCHS